ncbi:MAG: Fic family protein [Muribaculaceae bacterium]|nr:Fic family protein [Muribaculaceae bacterium]
MKANDRREELKKVLNRYNDLGISQQIDYDKFYLYSIITHSTAIEGSTVTEVEAQLLFEQGITSNKRTLIEQMMNLDLKAAYDYGIEWIKRHEDITVEWLCSLSARVMEHTGSEYKAMSGCFNAARGELRKLNVTAGVGGRSYMSYLKVPERLQHFCRELNKRRRAINQLDVIAVLELSFIAHYELVTIHPWADGNGRMARLLMNLLQIEYGVLPSKVLREDKAEYIQSLVDSREQDDVSIFVDTMIDLHVRHLRHDIDRFIATTSDNGGMASDKLRDASDKRAIIMDFIARHGECNAASVAAYIGLSPQRTRHYLSAMVADGLLAARGSNRNRTYLPKS